MKAVGPKSEVPCRITLDSGGSFSVLTASVITVAVGGVNLACANWWIPQYGIRGAVYALLAALVAGFCTNLAMAAYCEKRAHQKVN